MKYGISILAAILLSSMLSIDAEAQILNRLKQKAKEAAEQKAEEKLTEQVQQAAEQMVERSWNSVFGEFNNDSASGIKIPFTMSSNVTTEDSYHFDTITTMEIQTTNKNGQTEPPMIMKMHFNTNEMYTGTAFNSQEMNKEDGDLFIIYDFKNAAMLMLMSNDNEKFSFAYDWQQVPETAETDSLAQEDINWNELDEWQNYTKIGSKNMLGYNCDGYRSESGDEIIELWVTRDAEFGMNHLFKANANSKQMKGKIPEEYPYGMIMAINSENLKNGEKTSMTVTDIREDTNVRYLMGDYPAMTLGGESSKN